MEVIFQPDALADLEFWKNSGNRKIQKKIEQLLQSIMETPYSGIGKPEALKYELSGKWSRRINAEHRLTYKIENDELHVFSLRGHYKK